MLLVADTTEIGTLEYHLSSNHYGNALNRAKRLCSVCIALNLSLSDREEVGAIGSLQNLLLRITPLTGGYNACSFMY